MKPCVVCISPPPACLQPLLCVWCTPGWRRLLGLAGCPAGCPAGPGWWRPLTPSLPPSGRAPPASALPERGDTQQRWRTREQLWILLHAATGAYCVCVCVCVVRKGSFQTHWSHFIIIQQAENLCHACKSVVFSVWWQLSGDINAIVAPSPFHTAAAPFAAALPPSVRTTYQQHADENRPPDFISRYI